MVRGNSLFASLTLECRFSKRFFIWGTLREVNGLSLVRDMLSPVKEFPVWVFKPR